MKNWEIEYKDYKQNLSKIEEIDQKINFLQRFIKNNPEVPLNVLSKIYEDIGDIYSKAETPKASFYEKAASTLETAYALIDKNDKKNNKILLIKALKNYKKVLSIYDKQQFLSGIEETNRKISEVNENLKIYWGSFRKFALVGVMSLFVLSFFLISPNLTGFVTNADYESSSAIGIIFLIIAFIGSFIVLRKWYSIFH